LAIKFYTDVGKKGEQAACARCHEPFATKIHIDDLIVVEGELGYRYDWSEHSAGHYQHVCPACRRKLLALAQGHLWDAAFQGASEGRRTASDARAAGQVWAAKGVSDRPAHRLIDRSRPARQDTLLFLRAAVRHPAQGEGQRGHWLRAVGGLPLQQRHA